VSHQQKVISNEADPTKRIVQRQIWLPIGFVAEMRENSRLINKTNEAKILDVLPRKEGFEGSVDVN
jgi:hypothetical protein